MKGFIASILISLFVVSTITAQTDASANLKNITNRLEKDSGITATLEFTDNTQLNIFEDGSKGSFKLWQECFEIDIIKFRIWFDGTTLWTMNSMNGYEEIYITSPDQDELSTINPLLFLKQPGLAVKNGIDTGNSKSVIVPLQNLNIGEYNLQIEVVYNSENYRISQLNFSDINNPNEKVEIKVTNYKSGHNFNKAEFRCPASNYPDAEIVDMR